jgi:tRNA(fMet)-specific endonuclease VapC
MLDTDTCIYLIKRRSEALLSRLVATDPGEVCISVVTLAELRFGVEKSEFRERNAAALDAFLLPLIVAPFDPPAAEAYGFVSTALEGNGTPIGPLDTMIASHALSLHVDLVTNNLREFSRVKALRLTNWTT